MAPARLSFRRLPLALALAASCAVVIPAPVYAQDDDARLRKVESELRALQRAVFPGADGRFFTPEVDTSQAVTPTPGAPTTTAVSDMLIRLDTIEGQLAQITARQEEATNTMADLKARLAALEVADTDAINPQVPVGGAVREIGQAAAPTPTPAAALTQTPTPTPAPATTPAASGPSAERVAAVTAIAKPDTGDAGADEYTYGFRLWDAKFYPEAQQQLRKFVETYPSHAQISFGRNLLGRAFFDAGDARAAATWFLQNYQADKNGARAGDSLLYLAEAMISMQDTNRACIALAEFGDTYPALAAGRLKAQYERNRANVTCQ